MISSVATYIDTVLGLSLVAVAAAIHFRPRRHGPQGLHRARVRVHRRPHRLRIRLRTLPAPLATAGVALIVLGWLWPGDESPHPGAAPALLPEAAPTGDVTPTVHGVVLVHGTPTDDDTANDDDVRNYSQRLGTLVAQTLARPPLALHLEPRAVDAEQWKAIRDDPIQARGWCEETDNASFVAVVGLAALRLVDGAGYAPWREPEYVIVSCTSSRHTTVRGRVDERLGDRVPYEQAIVDDLKSALGKLVAGSD